MAPWGVRKDRGPGGSKPGMFRGYEEWRDWVQEGRSDPGEPWTR